MKSLKIHGSVDVLLPAIITFLAFGLVGCGNKGDLYLESDVRIPFETPAGSPKVETNVNVLIPGPTSDELLDELEVREAADAEADRAVKTDKRKSNSTD